MRTAGILVLGALLAAAGCRGHGDDDSEAARAMAYVRALGGTVDVDDEGDGPPVKVNLSGTPVTDAELEYLLWLPHCRSLLLRDTAVTDRGLAHVQGLRELQTVDLRGTRVTDAGVRELRAILPDLTVIR